LQAALQVIERRFESLSGIVGYIGSFGFEAASPTGSFGWLPDAPSASKPETLASIGTGAIEIRMVERKARYWNDIGRAFFNESEKTH
jgi:hypothetical protein